MHGYEMIQEIAERSGGAWKPSPGSVYPTLQLLEDEGLIASESEGGKKLFTLTDASRTEAEAGSRAPWEEVGRGVDWEAAQEIRQAGFGLMEAFGQVWKTGTPRAAGEGARRRRRGPQEALPDPRRRRVRRGGVMLSSGAYGYSPYAPWAFRATLRHIGASPPWGGGIDCPYPTGVGCGNASRRGCSFGAGLMGWEGAKPYT
ncbi:hypothetical protein GCM10020000_69040 [Streptomyces olivoverticillatus]